MKGSVYIKQVSRNAAYETGMKGKAAHNVKLVRRRRTALTSETCIK